MQGKITNWKAVVFWGVALGAVLLLVVGYIFKINPFYGWITGFPSWVGSQISSLTGGVGIAETISNTIKENPLAVVMAAISVGGSALALYEKALKAKAERCAALEQEAKMRALTANSSLESTVSKLKFEKESLEGQLKIYGESNLGQLYEEAKTTINQLTTQNNNLQGQVTGVQNQFTNFCKSLTANNETVVGPAGEIYKVIKITETIVK